MLVIVSGVGQLLTVRVALLVTLLQAPVTSTL